MMKNEEILQQLGLTDGESRVYIALLKLGSSTVGPIAKESKAAYSKIYEVLNRLAEKGLVSHIVKDKTRYYQALEPARLIEYLDTKEKELQENKKQLKDLLPQLNSLSNSKTKQTAEIFTGKKGLLTAYDLFIKKARPKSTLRFFYVHNPEYDDIIMNIFYGTTNYNNKILAPTLKKKKMKWLGLANAKGQKEISAPKPIIQKYTNIPLPGNIDITDNAILITTFNQGKISAILIESEDVATNFRNYFDSIWQTV